MSAPGLTILCAARLHGNQLERHLELFEHVKEVERVIVVRHAAAGARLSKVENHVFENGTRPANMARMYKSIASACARERVDVVMGFNPVPWGSVAFAAAKAAGIPTCLCLIGRDYLQTAGYLGWPFLQAVKRSDAVTVTGQSMLEGLVGRGVSRRKIRIVPHSVDTERFVVTDVPAQFDLLSVGQLIPRKRMDVVLDALGLLRERGIRLRLGILGKGELEGALRRQVEELKLSSQVTFLGYRDDVETVLKQARVFCLASEWEGVPFALMEAMSAGLVPVVTDVGTISDWIRDGENGRLARVGDPEHLAEIFEGLFSSDAERLQQLRATVVAEREKLGFAAGAKILSEVLRVARGA